MFDGGTFRVGISVLKWRHEVLKIGHLKQRDYADFTNKRSTKLWVLEH